MSLSLMMIQLLTGYLTLSDACMGMIASENHKTTTTTSTTTTTTTTTTTPTTTTTTTFCSQCSTNDIILTSQGMMALPANSMTPTVVINPVTGCSQLMINCMGGPAGSTLTLRSTPDNVVLATGSNMGNMVTMTLVCDSFGMNWLTQASFANPGGRIVSSLGCFSQ